MKIQCFIQLCPGRTDTQSDNLSSCQSKRDEVILGSYFSRQRALYGANNGLVIFVWFKFVLFLLKHQKIRSKSQAKLRSIFDFLSAPSNQASF